MNSFTSHSNYLKLLQLIQVNEHIWASQWLDYNIGDYDLVEHDVKAHSYFYGYMHFGQARGILLLFTESDSCPFVFFFPACLHLTKVNEIFLYAVSKL